MNLFGSAHGNRPGRLLARALEGSWRTSPPPLEISGSALDSIARALQRTQEAGLVWRRLSPAARATTAGVTLEATYRYVRLRNAMIERAIPRLVQAFEAHGAQPVLVKGWSVSRLYPERGLRPFGDVDVCVRASDASAAFAALENLHPLDASVDLHVDLTNEQGVRLLEASDDEVRARSMAVPFGDVSVAVLGWADQLRLICIHLWRHGAFRPLWWCDVGATLEALPTDFDWDLCLGRAHPRSDWVLYAVELAHRLLGARVPGLARVSLPPWLERAVLRQWSEFGEAEPRRLVTYLRHPRGLYHKMRYRWVNPLWQLQAWEAPLAHLPRWRYQVRELVTPGTRINREIPEEAACFLRH